MDHGILVEQFLHIRAQVGHMLQALIKPPSVSMHCKTLSEKRGRHNCLPPAQVRHGAVVPLDGLLVCVCALAPCQYDSPDARGQLSSAVPKACAQRQTSMPLAARHFSVALVLVVVAFVCCAASLFVWPGCGTGVEVRPGERLYVLGVDDLAKGKKPEIVGIVQLPLSRGASLTSLPAQSRVQLVSDALSALS